MMSVRKVIFVRRGILLLLRTILVAGILVAARPAMGASHIKEADLSGSWYPGSPDRLLSELKSYSDAVSSSPIDGEIFAIISPHAGIRFSGPVTAYGYRAVSDIGVKTVIVVGFSHRRSANGIAVYAGDAYRTPLGDIGIDRELAGEIVRQSPRFIDEPSLFDEENSIELQIPFIQNTFKDAKVVLIAFGAQSEKDGIVLADALGAVLRGKNGILVVASTDLSHNVRYDDSKAIDQNTIKAFSGGKVADVVKGIGSGRIEMCGALPVSSVLKAAEKLGYSNVRLLKYANSGDTAGGKDWFVGYLSAVIYKDAPTASFQDRGASADGVSRDMLDESQKNELIRIARGSVENYVGDGKQPIYQVADPALTRPCGAFVTLKIRGVLRGCIGNIVGTKPLYETVSDMAIAAAVEDPRFPPLTKRELGMIEIEVSVLSPLRKVKSYEEIVIPRHGVVVKRGHASGVYLPQVAIETGWTRDEFLSSLCSHKAGLPADAWKDPKTELYVFEVQMISEVA